MGFIHGEIQKEILALFIRSSSHKIDARLEWTLGPQASRLQVNWDSASPQGWSSQIDKLHTNSMKTQTDLHMDSIWTSNLIDTSRIGHD